MLAVQLSPGCPEAKILGITVGPSLRVLGLSDGDATALRQAVIDELGDDGARLVEMPDARAMVASGGAALLDLTWALPEGPGRTGALGLWLGYPLTEKAVRIVAYVGTLPGRTGPRPMALVSAVDCASLGLDPEDALEAHTLIVDTAKPRGYEDVSTPPEIVEPP